jgi:hypothetical protein
MRIQGGGVTGVVTPPPHSGGILNMFYQDKDVS